MFFCFFFFFNLQGVDANPILIILVNRLDQCRTAASKCFISSAAKTCSFYFLTFCEIYFHHAGIILCIFRIFFLPFSFASFLIYAMLSDNAIKKCVARYCFKVNIVFCQCKCFVFLVRRGYVSVLKIEVKSLIENICSQIVQP